MFPLTPKLKSGDDRKIGNFKKEGVWDSRAAAELANLSISLNCEEVAPKSIELTGIPTMWARPILFEMALYDIKHPLHNRILGEWRGFLAMIALKQWRKLPLSFKKISIPYPNDHDVPMSQFINALGKLAPQKTLSTDTDWHNLYVIMFNNKPIGMTSPTTLVCTAANYFSSIKNLSWFDSKFLADPTPFLNPKEKEVLAVWLEKLAGNIDTHPQCKQDTDEDKTLLSNLLGLIIGNEDVKEGFVHDLKVISKPQIKLEEMGFGMTEGIFRYLDKSIKSDITKTVSHVQLKGSSTLPSIPLIVIDKTIADQWGLKQHDITVQGTLTLDSIPFGGLGINRNAIDSEPLDGKAEWIKPEEFFTEKLFVIQQQNAFPGTIKTTGEDSLQFQGQIITPILPIKEKLLNYLTIEDLSHRVSFEQRAEGIMVNLRLPLVGLDGNGRDFSLKKEFKFGTDEIISISTVPVLEVWPNFIINKLDGDRSVPIWNHYYTYFSTAGELKTFYAKPFTYGREDTEHLQVKDRFGKKIELEIKKLDMFPAAIICDGDVINPQTNSLESFSAGILLLNQPQPIIQQQNKEWTIGIDFGTSSTNVFSSTPDGGPQPVIFTERFLKVTAASDIRRTCLYDNFLPGKKEDPPFLSIFHDFQRKANDSLSPLLDGHIYFLYDYTNFNATAPGMVTNLKWSEDPIVRMRTEAFLEQLCLLCSAEAVAGGAKKITWRFSYPTSFSKSDMEVFERIWGRITKKTGIDQSVNSPENKSESIASAHFFAYHPKLKVKEKGDFTSGMVCVDIGGGTSDISIYQKDKLFWQTSLRFAGRHMFLDLLYENSNFLKNIFGTDISSLNKTKEESKKIAFYSQADVLIRKDGEKWLSDLHFHKDIPEMEGFTHLIAVGLSGILFYIGLLLKVIAESTSYNAQMPNIYVAGNGAKMFHWLGAGNYSSNSPISNLFKEVLLKASGFNTNQNMFNIYISPDPKAEAAFGLVCPMRDLDESGKTDGVIAGESFIEGTTQCDWSEIITPERMIKGLKVPTTIQNIENYIETFNSYANTRGAVTSAIKVDNMLTIEIIKQLANTLGDVSSDVKKIHIEPLFITELKALIKIKTDEWVGNFN